MKASEARRMLDIGNEKQFEEIMGEIKLAINRREYRVFIRGHLTEFSRTALIELGYNIEELGMQNGTLGRYVNWLSTE